MSETYLQVETTVGSREDAERIADEIVGARLAACAQIIGPIRSLYWWDGAVQNDEEFLVLLKTRSGLLDELKARLTRAHTYEVPELLAFEVADGAQSYLDWLSGETARSGR